MRENLGARHGAAKFEQAARHVIGRGDQAQGIEALIAHPGGGLGGVAAGIVRLVAEKHAALKLPRRLLADAQQLRDLDAAVDAGHEELLGARAGEQLQALLEAAAAAGQHDDGITLRRRIGDFGGHERGEPQQSGEPGRQDRDRDAEQAVHEPPLPGSTLDELIPLFHRPLRLGQSGERAKYRQPGGDHGDQSGRDRHQDQQSPFERRKGQVR